MTQDAVVTAECTTHIEQKADRVRGIRREKRWYRQRPIGHGTFGDVWLEVRLEDDDVEKRAVKIINKSRMLGLEVDYKKELLALAEFSKLQYQQEDVFVRFFGWFEDSSHLFLSMEYFELGNLEKHIKESITEDDMKDITTDILNGLRIMHSENFAHRDLKPANIFVVQKPPTSNWWVKIGGDFGTSKRVESGITAFRTRIGTHHYRAPEINSYLDSGEPTLAYDNTVDIWSLGCVIYKIATQSVPFPKPRAVEKFCDGSLPFPEQPLSAKVSTDGVQFVKCLIVPNPRERLSAESALEAPWLSQRKHDIISKAEEPAKRSAPTTGQTAKFGFGFHNETGMSLYAKEPAARVTYIRKGPLETADRILNEKGDKTLLPQTSNDEVVRPRLVQNVTSSSPDSKLVVSASNDRTARLWDSATGALRRTLEGHSGSVNSVAFSPDGKLVASASSDGTARLWGSATGALRRVLEGHSGNVLSVAFSPDGKLVASASDDRTARLWDSATGAPRRTLEGYSGNVLSVAFSPGGELVVSACHDRAARLWNTATGAVRRTRGGSSSRVNAFSPDGQLVASTSCGRTIELLDSVTGTLRCTLEGHSSYVNDVAFSPDGKLVASASCDRTARLWDSATGALRRTLEGHSSYVNAVAFSPDGKLVASASYDRTIRLWDSATGAAGE